MQVGEIRLPIYDRKGKRWAIGHRRGRVFEVDGKTVELFPIQVLAETLGQTPHTIRKWERAKMFPAPMFKIPVVPKRPTHFYSKVQIANIRAVFQQYPKRNQTQDFCRGVWPVFYLLKMTSAAKNGEVT